MSTLISVADASRKWHLREAYFEKQRRNLFVPTNGTTQIFDEASAASHVAGAFNQWAKRFDLPPGEGNVIMSLSGSMFGVAETTDETLHGTPIEARTKTLLQLFFGSVYTKETQARWYSSDRAQSAPHNQHQPCLEELGHPTFI